MQPRCQAWDDEELIERIQGLDDDDELQSASWLALAVGNRGADLSRLFLDQLELHEVAVEVDWWLRKAQRKRRDRKKGCLYEFVWSCAPPANVIRFLGRKSTNPEELIFPNTKRFGLKSFSTTLTTFLKSFNSAYTSYVYRDRLCRPHQTWSFS